MPPSDCLCASLIHCNSIQFNSTSQACQTQWKWEGFISVYTSISLLVKWSSKAQCCPITTLHNKPNRCFVFFFFFLLFLFGGTGVWTQCLMVARQELYLWTTLPAPPMGSEMSLTQADILFPFILLFGRHWGPELRALYYHPGSKQLANLYLGLEVGSYYVAQVTSEFLLFQPLTSKWWDYRCVFSYVSIQK
jgi:hypothetical protein